LIVARPYCIAIAGGSGSGKSRLARFLARARPATVLCLDSYYRDLSGLDLAQRHHQNFDTPEALDWDLMMEQFGELAEGREIEQPVYSFVTHSRTGETRRIRPEGLVIFEGLFALYNTRLRGLCGTKVFVEVADRLGLERRLARDTTERGRSAESVIRQYQEQVQPMYERYVLPTRAFADLVLRGDEPVEKLVEAVLERVGS
jgi:uridine kinase